MAYVGTPRGMMTCPLAVGVLPSSHQEEVEGDHGGSPVPLWHVGGEDATRLHLVVLKRHA